MDNYSKVLEFFMENGITLNKEQLEELKVVCNEATKEQIDNVKNQYRDKAIYFDYDTKKFTDNKSGKDIIRKYGKDMADAIDKSRSKQDKASWEENRADTLNFFGHPIAARGVYAKSLIDQKKANNASKAADKVIAKTIDKDEEEAYKENEKRSK